MKEALAALSGKRSPSETGTATGYDILTNRRTTVAMTEENQ
jgi:hypothetical protein